MASKNYKELLVWQKSHEWVLRVYEHTRGHFPKEELYSLTSQLRRSAISVPSNIAEGFKRRGIADKLRFYNIAEASLTEADYQLLLAHDLGYGDTSKLLADGEEIGRLLTSYISSIERNQRGSAS